ncbi:MAG: tryptophan synthase subunit alpha [Candidatus Aquicultor sp.]|nr:tryptophan synthase subunit alpha [Candidatus Aquicultor sp.]
MAITRINRIDAVFDKLEEENRTALMPYLMAGYPDVETSLELLVAVAKAGADLIEFGVPYSDPLADGPTIQAAGEVALRNGVNTDTVFTLVRRARESVDTPVVVMTYYNTIYRYGLERFAQKAAESGVDGVIAPDLPPEEAAPWADAASKYGVATVMLVAPTSTDKRIERISELSKGFVYCVSLTGVTGARANLPSNLTDFIYRVRALTDKPLAVGFGISEPEQAKEVSEIADGVIIGSALVGLIGKAGGDCVEAARAYMSRIREAIDT